jgi:hypothetical protein
LTTARSRRRALLGVGWEDLNDPNFDPIEFGGFRRSAGLNSFILTVK